jgi:prevent-host-death family protein
MSERDVAATTVQRHFTEHLDAVLAGESFTITRHGRIAAVLIPPPEQETPTR